MASKSLPFFTPLLLLRPSRYCHTHTAPTATVTSATHATAANTAFAAESAAATPLFAVSTKRVVPPMFDALTGCLPL